MKATTHYTSNTRYTKCAKIQSLRVAKIRSGGLPKNGAAGVGERKRHICIIGTDNIPILVLDHGFNIVAQHRFVVRERITHALSHKIPPLRIDVLNLFDVVDEAYKNECITSPFPFPT